MLRILKEALKDLKANWRTLEGGRSSSSQRQEFLENKVAELQQQADEVFTYEWVGGVTLNVSLFRSMPDTLIKFVGFLVFAARRSAASFG